MTSDVKLRLQSLARRAGLAGVSKPVLVCLSAVVVLLLVFALWRFWPAGPASAGSDFSVDISQDGSAASQTDGEAGQDDVSAGSDGLEKIKVDVEGAVRYPGLYELASGSRVGDAIKAAGGTTKKAAKGQVNLAEVLQDGQQVTVPTKGQVSAAAQSGATGGSATGSATRSGSQGSGEQGKININTASASELQELSGIGESLSQRIVDYRNANGAFASVDDLVNVSGIGDARLEQIRSKICV